MVKSCKLLGVKVQEPFWVELEREDDIRELESWLLEYLVGAEEDQKWHFRHPTICVAVLGYENNYP